MNADEKNKYFQELSRNLRHEGLIVKPETEEGLLPVELDGQRLCLALDTGAVRYWKEDVADDRRSAVLNRVTDITKITAEYMRQMEAVPQLTASGLTGDYRLLAKFNDTVLAGHPSKYGVQFITWEWVQDQTALYQGNYYGPEGGTDSYAAANIDQLDYLAKRLDGFCAGEVSQFQAMAHKLEMDDIKDFINLTYCCQQATVITDFSDLEAVGRSHFINLNGGSARTEELENLDGEETAYLLIDGGGEVVTPYGVVYDNGMVLEQEYNGHQCLVTEMMSRREMMAH